MATVIYDDLLACDDCTIAIANADYTGMTDERAAEVETALDQWAERGYLVLGREWGFSWRGCDICHSGLGGNRHTVTLLGD